MSHFVIGVLAALGAGLLWGSVFVVPLLLPDYPAAYLTFGRYIAFGLVTLPIAWWQRNKLRKLTRSDWWIATRLSLIGNFVYYLALSSSIQMAGAPLPTLLIGTLPVVIAVCSQFTLHGARISWRALMPSLLIMALGLLCVNAHQLESLALADTALSSLTRYLLGGGVACIAVAAWTWYPLRNSQWLTAHPSVSGATWASAQGLVTLPMGIVGWCLSWFWYSQQGADSAQITMLGHSPDLFVGLMLLMGLGASWLGTLFWNIASQRTTPSLTGQLIVFETLAALGYAYVVYARWPSTLEMAGIVCLIAGVLIGVRQLRSSAPPV